ncbi:MAG: magnesium/cobalt transporter CorA [Bacteroidota bacterium]
MQNKSNKRKKLGQQPGEVVFTGQRKVERVSIHYLEYNAESCDDQELDNQSITSFHEPVEEVVQWYDVRGLHDTQLIEEIGRVFHIHPLALEDIADTTQRPKLDEYTDGILITLRALHFNTAQREMRYEHVAIYLGDGYVLSFQESDTDLFSGVRNRITQRRGRVRNKWADYLAYALMDAIVDKYYLINEQLELTIEQMETMILEDPDRQLKGQIHDLKQELLVARRSVSPLREVVSSFDRLGTELVSENTLVFLRDLRDHVVQVTDLIETYRDMINSLHDLYLSELSFRMNNVMQVLTIMSTIFIPLSFFTGLYGMNFDHMPELTWRNGYFYLLALMGSLVLGMLWYFRRKRWL